MQMRKIINLKVTPLLICLSACGGSDRQYTSGDFINDNRHAASLNEASSMCIQSISKISPSGTIKYYMDSKSSTNFAYYVPTGQSDNVALGMTLVCLQKHGYDFLNQR